jgi:cytochrome c oxidase subunit 2
MKVWLEAASEYAGRWELLNIYLHLWLLIFTVIVFAGTIYLAIRYRRRVAGEIAPKQVEGSFALEMIWILVPLVIALSMFVWGAALYYDYGRPPGDATEVFVVGKQWMFYIQHATGQREINELHVPTGRVTKLTMSSEDVIHSFFIPAFRVKRDVLPGRYTSIWFMPTEPGRYRLFCAEYCGTSHSGMTGWVHVMAPADYERWLAQSGSESLSAQGEKLYRQYGCANCHLQETQGRGPMFHQLYGSRVLLSDGTTTTADEAYIRESILRPGAHIVAGFADIMPPFEGQLTEREVLQIIAYIRSLQPRQVP